MIRGETMEVVNRTWTQRLDRIVWPSATKTPLCAACNSEIECGHSATRIVLGPGPAPRERELCLNEKPYKPTVAWLHWACATGDEEGVQDSDVREGELRRINYGDGQSTAPEPLRCAACSSLIVWGQHATLVMVGPGIDPFQRARCYAGRAYNAQALPVHWACATGDCTPHRTYCAQCKDLLGEDKTCHNRGNCSLAV